MQDTDLGGDHLGRPPADLDSGPLLIAAAFGTMLVLAGKVAVNFLHSA